MFDFQLTLAIMSGATFIVLGNNGLVSIDTDGLFCGTGSRCLCDLSIDTSGVGAVVHHPGLSILVDDKKQKAVWNVF